MSEEPARPVGSAVAGPTLEWNLVNARRGETRTYVQAELAIDGEARLIGIARKVGIVLAEAGYSFGDLGELFDERSETDWPKVMDLVGRVGDSAPEVIADAATVFLSIYPTNEDGTPNTDYDDHRAFIRGSINLTRFVDMIRVFLAVNEYARLIEPFSRTLSEVMAAYGTPSGGTPASSEPSEEPAIVGTDGLPVQLEPLTPTSEPPPSATETPSGRSRRSRKPASAASGASSAD